MAGLNALPAQVKLWRVGIMATDDDRMLADHQQMWNRFCKIMLFAVIGAIIVLGGMGIFLAP
jgi:hypothetical protein